jgi:3-oxoacyl-[acyl-carrier-protein] synthase II
MPTPGSSPPHRVFVTGLGIISPMGGDETAHLESMREGRTHFREIDFFDVSRQRVQTAGVAPIPSQLPANSRLSTSERKRLDRGVRLVIHATAQALETAGLSTLPDGTPLVVGTSAGAMSLGEEFFKKNTRGDSGRNDLTLVEHYQPQRQLSLTQRALGFRADPLILSNACASGANALGHAFGQVRSGRHSIALAGGYDALCQLVFAGFDSLQALAESGIPRPFDSQRDGLALGEGAAMFILENEESMLSRGATPWAELTGYGMATDLHHLTQPDPAGSAAHRSMTAACQQAKIEPAAVQYINSHGTGTPRNDVAEANAITSWAGDAVSRIAVSSTKSAMGHLLGGAGAVESALCLFALRHGLLPASLNIREPDEACTFDLVREPRQRKLETVLTNSFGFGGSNASLVFQAAS